MRACFLRLYGKSLKCTLKLAREKMAALSWDPSSGETSLRRSLPRTKLLFCSFTSFNWSSPLCFQLSVSYNFHSVSFGTQTILPHDSTPHPGLAFGQLTDVKTCLLHELGGSQSSPVPSNLVNFHSDDNWLCRVQIAYRTGMLAATGLCRCSGSSLPPKPTSSPTVSIFPFNNTSAVNGVCYQDLV